MKQIFVFYGYKGSGKDTCFEILRDKLGSVKVSFADKLKEVCWDLFQPKLKNPDRIWGSIDIKEELIEDWPMSDFIKKTYNFTEDFWSGRRILQFMGTEVGREIYGNIWVDLTKKKILQTDNHIICITDCRFLNEAKMLSALPHDLYRVVFVKVSRGEDNNGFSGHASEQDLKNFISEFTISNNGTIQELSDKVLTISDKIARIAMTHRVQHS